MHPISRPSRRALGPAIVLALVVSAPAAGAPAEPGPCTEDGVTVVVDFTDRGGEVVVGCATGDPATGREALEAAGFLPTDSIPGMICAIDATPDPCPEEFDGTYWSYWFASPDGEWTAYQEGADTADPASGMLEGWRLNDGSVGPGIAPADASVAAVERAPTEGAPTEDAPTEDAPTEDADATDAAPAENPPLPWIIAGVLLVAFAAAAMWRRRA